MALGTFVAGRYSSTITPPAGMATDLGLMDEDGYALMFTPQYHLVQDTDAWGAQVLDGFWRGFSDVGIDFTCHEYKAGPLRIVNPGDTFAPTGAETFKADTIGRSMLALAGILVLTATASTPAASSPATLTATYAAIREGFQVKWLMGPKQRKIPISMRFFGYDVASAPVYFTAT